MVGFPFLEHCSSWLFASLQIFMACSAGMLSSLVLIEFFLLSLFSNCLYVVIYVPETIKHGNYYASGYDSMQNTM